MFYQLKVKADAKRVPTEVLGFPVSQQVSTYVETSRDLRAEADKKNLKTTEVVAISQLPERDEAGNSPRVFRLGDAPGEAAAGPKAEEKPAEKQPETKTEPIVPTGSDESAPDDDETTDDLADDDELPKKQYRVLEGSLGGGVEYPTGTVHEPGTILELTDEEAGLFADDLIEPVDSDEETK